MTHRIGTLGFAAVLLLATSARAQISAPPPTLQGEPSVHAWTVPGVVSNGNLATIFTCTNTLRSTVIVGVELFGPTAGAALNDASDTSLAVAPGATVLFSTGTILSFEADSNLGRLVSKGSARVLTTAGSKASQALLCTAILTDRNDPPSAMTGLPVIRKTTQQGD